MFYCRRDTINQLIVIIAMLAISGLATTAHAVEPEIPEENNLSVTPTSQPMERPSTKIYLPLFNKSETEVESSVTRPDTTDQETQASPMSRSGNTILTLRVQQSSDDARYHSGAYGYSHTRTDEPFGGGGVATPTPIMTMGWRFTNITIPPGATIVSAHLSVVKKNNHWARWNFDWYGEASDNAVTFSSGNTPEDRSRTTAFVSHSDDVNHLDGVRYTLDDLTSVVQEIVDRPNWQSGNALAILARSDDGGWDRKWWYTFDFDNNPNGPNVPELVIVYQMATPPLPSNVIVVDDTATGANDGSSWADAYTDLQTALATATAGDEIWVAEGIYTPGSNRGDSFSLKNDVEIYGGFAATETVRTQRDYTSNYSVLSGDIGGDDTTDSHGLVTNTTNIVGGNSYHVIQNSNILTSTLDGFFITGGQATGSSNDGFGGGLINTDSNPILTNLTLVGNIATQGGGIRNWRSNPTLTNVDLIRNVSTPGQGGGMTNVESSPTLIDVTFTENSSPNGGGAIYNVYYSSPILTNVSFIGNTANSSLKSGGGIFNTFYSNPILTNVTFIGNSAGELGGGMYNHDHSSPTLTNVTFTGNSTNHGGGMYSAHNSNPTLTNVIMWGNTATSSGNQIKNYNSTPTISYSLIEGSGGSGASWSSSLGTDGGNNIDADPLFTVDYQLSDNSPAIDAGLNSAMGETADLADNPRFYDDTGVVDSGTGTAPIIDLGAYEKQTNSPAPPPSNVILVNDTATGANNGSSWADAYTDLQTALTTATAGDEIWVAEGIYTPGSSRGDSFSLKNDVEIYGGFAGTESIRTQRDYTSNYSVLSGDIGGDDITDSHGLVTNTTNIVGGNSYHVIDNSNILTSTLDGFFITAGKGRDRPNDQSGAGMNNFKSSPRLINLTFIGNSAEGIGGGIYNNQNSNPMLMNITFTANNASAQGGGMANAQSSPTLINVTFRGNSAQGGGGGIYNVVSSPTLTNVIFEDNSASSSTLGYGGGMFNTIRSNPTLANVIFINNSSGRLGGGMYNHYYASPTLTNVTFTGNSTNAHGGGMYNGSNSNPILRNVIMWGNTATTSGNQISNDVSSIPEPGITMISYSLIEGSGGSGAGWSSSLGTDGGNNIDVDPLFMADYQLSGNSPAIDAGLNSAMSETTDLAGNPRFYDDIGVADSGTGTAPIIDLGAYEKQTNSP